MMKPLSWMALVLIGLVLVILDQATKLWIVTHFPLYQSPEQIVFSNVLGIDFSITHAINTGAAWGYFANYQLLLLGLRCIVITALIIYLSYFVERPVLQLPLLLIISGAIGNVIDFFVYGHVVDMFHFILFGYDWPIFNVADILICLGTAWIVLLAIFEKEKA